MDFDTVSLSNLQRQILHRDDRIGQSKVASAVQELSAINPHIRIDAIDGRLEDEAVAARSPPAIWCWTAPTTWRRATP